MSSRIVSSRIGVSVAVIAICLSLAGCGRTPGQRAVSGGLLGAGTGALIGGATGGNPLTGALIGGGVGAVGGAVTAPRRY
jgi:osmotically inducible lipoprotein OsmB